MGTWDLPLLLAVAKSTATLHTPPWAKDIVRRDRIKAAKRFADEIRLAHAVHVELTDLHFREDTVFAGTTLRTTIQWAPDTDEIELLGGPQDGTVMALQGAPSERLRLLEEPPDPFESDRLPVNAEVVHTHTEWTCTGWSEDNRRWIYTQDQP